MCRKLKNERAGIVKRFIVWLAWLILKPKCKDCEEAETCAYNSIMEQKDEEKTEG